MAAPIADGTRFFYLHTRLDGIALEGDFAYPQPRSGRPGEWLPEFRQTAGSPRRGYYGFRRSELPDWSGPELWIVELDGGTEFDADKFIGKRARLVSRIERWNRRTMALFACDAVGRYLSRYNELYPRDCRLRETIAAIRKSAAGRGSASELRVLAGSADDAAEITGHSAYNARRAKNKNADALLDAAQAARKTAAIAHAIADPDPTDFRPFVVRPDTKEERQWQIDRKLAYMAGTAAPLPDAGGANCGVPR